MLGSWYKGIQEMDAPINGNSHIATIAQDDEEAVERANATRRLAVQEVEAFERAASAMGISGSLARTRIIYIDIYTNTMYMHTSVYT